MPPHKRDTTATEKTRATALQALDQLQAHGLPPVPLNYSVIYEYLQGSRPDLKKTLDQHLQSGKPLDAILLQDLYDRHIASEYLRHVQGMRNNLEGLLQGLHATLSETSDNHDTYQHELEAGLQKLTLAEDQQALQSIAGEMISATMAANFQTGNLLAQLAEAVKETEQLRAELEIQRREVMTDPLTGLFNRRGMDIQLTGLWEEGGDYLSVLALDVDHFKRINDSHGHAVGDVVLRNVAESVRKCIRGEDVAIRYGGEEFLVLLPNTPLEGAVTVAESIRKRIAALRLVRKTDNFTMDPFTISLGVAQRRQGDDRESLFERADRALRQAKAKGRNRVMREPPPD